MSRRRRGAELEANLARAEDPDRRPQDRKTARKFLAKQYLDTHVPAAAIEALLGAAKSSAAAMRRGFKSPQLSDARKTVLKATRMLLDAQSGCTHLALLPYLAVEHGPMVPSVEQISFLQEIFSPGDIVDRVERDRHAEERRSRTADARFAVEMLTAGIAFQAAPLLLGPAELRAFAIVSGIGDGPLSRWTKTRQRALVSIRTRLNGVRKHLESSQRACLTELARAEERCLECGEPFGDPEEEETTAFLAKTLGKTVEAVREQRRLSREKAAEPERWASMFDLVDRQLKMLGQESRTQPTKLRLASSPKPN